MDDFLNGRFKVSIKTLQYLEPLLQQELTAIGASQIEAGKRVVHAQVNKEQLYRCNLELRTALRVLIPIAEFHSRGPEDLYKQLRKVDWANYLFLNHTFAIDASVHSPQYKLPHYAALKAKDAIVDYFNDEFGRRPSIDTERPDMRFHLHIDEHKVSFSLDSSGDSLNKRGYRRAGAMAPLNEVLAAAMVMLSEWDQNSDLYIPMCGSGTLAIEAAMMSLNIPAGWNRKQFGFMQWKNFDEKLWGQIRNDVSKNFKTTKPRIFASDVEMKAIKIAEINIKDAGLEKFIQLYQSDFFELKKQSESGTLIINPPYGERLDEEQVDFLYQRIGDHLKQNFAGHSAWIISSNIPALKKIGLKPSKRLDLLNGPLQCKFVRIDLFRGSRIDFIKAVNEQE
ncbi:MAG: THUMP domain-containing class I SAM-dependent RNA methyltransferase [Flavobacteriales bacterium]